MKIKTKITEMLNIDVPIIGAPMFLVSYPDLVAAVSNAGGIGTFPALNYRSIEALKDGIQEIRTKTNKPIGVNIILFKRHNPKWYEQLKVCLDEKVDLIIASLGTPKSVLGEIRSAGAKIFCDVTTLKHARIVAKIGVDAIIAVSQGAGGHAGAISPFSLIPYIKKEVGLPVIAAGSIGTGEQMAAGMALGADAVYVGTRLIASQEAKAKNSYKQMLISEKPEDIVYTDEITGIFSNWLKKSLEQVNYVPHSLASQDSQEELKKWKDIFSAGHGIAQIKEILPVKEIMKNLLDGYLQAIKNNLPQP